MIEILIERFSDAIIWGSYFLAALIGFGLEAIFGFTRRFKR